MLLAIEYGCLLVIRVQLRITLCFATSAVAWVPIREKYHLNSV
ncbi:hypothetical protein AM1_A0178 (plasmid) [Acaryochloris marina MBIC11017]|uniref:Uncharacterized protein n=1 Tax=Acaryochloris marina (strain MBIC 11017) TaxID=329726 RepID=A8ZKI5_ACAM1|nr:hypothetical protein AM1_A0178 [Acaryochloris marina MBIC11017]